MTNSDPDEEVRAFPLDAPPDQVPDEPPVVTKVQELPFGKLTWENFERLCYRLAGSADQVEHYALYGRRGQAQQGIDIFVRRKDGKYDVWQAKRYTSFSAAKVKTAVNKFLKGNWVDRTERLFLAVQSSLADTKIQEEIETQAVRLRKKGISFISCGGEDLSEAIRKHPILVDDFFGRPWAEAFLGDEAAKNLGSRSDGREFARIREQLCKFYQSHFHSLDVGDALPFEGVVQRDVSPSLLERFAAPDIFVREKLPDFPVKSGSNEERPLPAPITEKELKLSAHQRESTPSRRNSLRRIPLHNWLGDGSHLAVVGDVGMGKSTLLRCIALDLLSEQAYFPEIASRWGSRLPLHIPFAAWTRAAVDAKQQVGLKGAVNRALQLFLTADLPDLLDQAIDDRRILLLIDGLDEWSDEQAARATLQVLISFTATHDIPTIVTARPSGLRKIGSLPASWRIGTLAPLSYEQQKMLASTWFSRFLARGDLEPENSGSSAQVVTRTETFFRELRRDGSLSSLAEVPLLLVGLVALAIRQFVLPRNKTQVVQKLVEILLEIHPQSRATAAGDTQTRLRTYR